MDEKNVEMQVRIQNFDRELRTLQEKYELKIVAQVIFPAPEGQAGAVLSVPITVVDMLVKTPPEKATNPE